MAVIKWHRDPLTLAGACISPAVQQVIRNASETEAALAEASVRLGRDIRDEATAYAAEHPVTMASAVRILVRRETGRR